MTTLSQQADGTLRATTPTSTPVPPSWATVAPLLARWQMLLLPTQDRSWDVCSGWPRLCGLPRHAARGVPFAALPQAIQDVAARCEADAAGEGGG